MRPTDPCARAVAGAFLSALFAASALAADGCGDQSALPEAERLGHQLKWSSRSELQSSHYDVYRADSPDGEFAKVNAEPIEAAGISAVPRHYEYTDRGIDPCRTYYYFIEAVSARDGYRVKLTPVIEAKPKREPAAAD